MKKIDIQSIQVSMYPKTTDIHVSKYPCIRVSINIQVSTYPSIQKKINIQDIQVSGYQKKVVSTHPYQKGSKVGKIYSIVTIYLRLHLRVMISIFHVIELRTYQSLIKLNFRKIFLQKLFQLTFCLSCRGGTLRKIEHIILGNLRPF